MTRTLKLPEAARELGCSVDTLRRYIRGAKASGKKSACEPVLEEYTHWFRRGQNPGPNAPYLIRIDAAKEQLARFGYYTPGPGTLTQSVDEA